MKVYVVERESGDILAECRSKEEAGVKIADFITDDIERGLYEPGYYDIADEEGNRLTRVNEYIERVYGKEGENL